ncbi:MAG TPA: alpha/beta hydrolase [Gemmatimonadaceae bacterium]|nr:alpha/beta hydrolase [Gemmatimonadaceae bacterium]
MRSLKWLPLLLTGLGAAACDNTMSPGEPGNLVPRTVAEDDNLPAIEMNGARFHAETFGNPANPVIVFLHGGPGGDYRSLLRLAERRNGYSLADEYFLVYWDQRGSGLSQRQNKGFLTTAIYVNDLNTLIDRYSPGRRVFLIGESWGGMFATRYINQYPQRVRGAVLIESGPLDGATMERLKGDIAPIDLGSEWLNDYAWSSQFLSPDDHARMDYERMIGMKDGQPKFHQSTVDPAPSWRLGAAANRYISEDGQNGNGVFTYDFTTNLSAFTRPVLFVTGSWSEVLGASLQQQQVLRYPSASLDVVDGAGHDVAWVKSAEVITRIRAYLDARKGDNQ